MRGKVLCAVVVLCVVGITPAYAGKSELSAALDWEEGDHPRLCGEKFKEHFTGAYNARITPAYAGKSQQNTSSTFCQKDHPRLCGEKSCCCWGMRQ